MNLFMEKDKKHYNEIMEMIKEEKYDELFTLYNKENFGLTHQDYIYDVSALLAEKMVLNPSILIKMNEVKHPKSNYFNEIVISSSPKIIENFLIAVDFKNVELESNIDKLLDLALDNGYLPRFDEVVSHKRHFSSINTLTKILNNGYDASSVINLMENYNLFDDNLVSKAIDLGYKPSVSFIFKNDLLHYPDLVDKVIDNLEESREIFEKPEFYNNATLRKKIIEKHPDLTQKLNIYYDNLLWFLEAFKHGHLPDNITSIVMSNYPLITRVIKEKPELIKECDYLTISSSKEKLENLSQLALAMGYVPSLNDVRNNAIVSKSVKLMENLISNRPEAIKYIETRPFSGSYNLVIQNSDFYDLARLSLEVGYIPSVRDLEQNPRLADSFDIMKFLIKSNPELINFIREETPDQEELLKIAIESGFNGVISDVYWKTNEKNNLVLSETALLYQLNRSNELEDNLKYNNNYGIKLYNILIRKGYKIEDIIHLFNGNYSVMKEIISTDPRYIVNLSIKADPKENQYALTRKEIDELSFLAIEKGYVPSSNDEVFGYGEEIAKVMVKKFPSYIEKVVLYDRGPWGVKFFADMYEDVCKIAVDAGFDFETEDALKQADKYVASYDIMKKLLPLNLRLIEECQVVDKEQFDELCSLALSYGYYPNETSDLAFLKKNYQMMEKYIKDNPSFLLNLDIENAEEMLKLIDIAIDNGFDLNTLSKNELLRLFISTDEEKWSKYLDDDVIKIFQRVKELYVSNNEISDTINLSFFNSEIINHLTKSQIEVLSCYGELQNKIVKLANDEVKLDIIYTLLDKYKDNLEWVPFLEKTLENISSPEFISLFEDIKDKKLSSSEKEDLLYLLMTNNHLDIYSYDELQQIEVVRTKYIDLLIARNTLGSLKNAYLEKVFGIDLQTAMSLVTLYGGSLASKEMDSLSDDARRNFVLLENMKKIVELNNLEVLHYYIDHVNPEIEIKPSLMLSYETRLKNTFVKEFNDSFTKPRIEDKVNSGIAGEEKLDIYLAAGVDGSKKCRMMITSIGAYAFMDEPDDYYASWNVNQISSHSCCCSYVGEKNLGTAEVKYCCLGFTDYEDGSLLLSAPYDLSSASKKESFQVESRYSGMYLLPGDILDNTRHTHNETVWERRNITKKEKFKKQPSYVVYFVDNFEDRLTDPEAMRQWETVKKAASNFGTSINGEKKFLPIMVVEREKIAKAQLQNIEQKLEEFKTTLDYSLIKDIVSDYESNYAGNKKYHLNIATKYFPVSSNFGESMAGKIMGILEEKFKTNPEAVRSCIVELERVVKVEQAKYGNINHGGVEHATASFDIEKTLTNIAALKDKVLVSKNSILVTISNSRGNDRYFEENDSKLLDEMTLVSQLSSEDVINLLNVDNLADLLARYENEIKDEGINSNFKVHGKRHINNVLLYSLLIGENTLNNEKDLELLLVSVKYHDAGRISDAHEAHAKAGAKIATSKLKDKYSSDDLAMINTIIEFHEIPRDYNCIDEMFSNMARNNGVREEDIPKTRYLAEILKDADALDRTRFIGSSARLNPEFLKYDVSKKLVKFAASMSETYALEDLKEYECDDSICELLEEYTPQDILKTIRYSTKSNFDKEGVRNFVDSWLLATKEKTGGSYERK